MGIMSESQGAEKFVKNFFHALFCKCDTDNIIEMLHPEVSWVGISKEDTLKNREDVKNFLDNLRKTYPLLFSVKFKLFKTDFYNDNFCVLHGVFNLKENVDKPALYYECRFSVAIDLLDDKYKIKHLHLSFPVISNEATEQMRLNLDLQYKEKLEKELKERTKELKRQKETIESLTNNLQGGIMICRFDENFTIKYTSNGFTALCGFTSQDIKTLFNNKNTKLIDFRDAARIKQEVRSQLEAENSYSVEYRINCKDGKTKWIMDKGELFTGEDGELEIHCIISDITFYKEQQEALKISEKRHEIALKSSNITMFEYDVISGELLFYDDVAKMYGIPTVVPDGVETFVKSVIEPVSETEYREMYRKIHNGEPSATCFIKTRDINGIVHDFKLHLTNIFNDDGKPVRAIGVRTNISHIKMLERENEFGKNLVAGKTFIFEADINNDKMDYLHPDWTEKLAISQKHFYMTVIKQICRKLIHPNYAKLFYDNLSIENIKNKFHDSENLMTFEYISNDGQGEYKWYEAIVNVIKDLSGDCLSLRFYRMDISELKRKQERAFEEQRLYDSMLSDAKRAYEINITKNIAIRGHEFWKEHYGIEYSNNYSELIAEFSNNAVYTDDRHEFYDTLCRENVLKSYKNGLQQIACEYRTMEMDGIYRWNNCILHLYEDPTTSNIKGFAYIVDIDERKCEELNLKYMAEHDIMTGFYNKITVENKINDLLDKKNKYAFFIIDIDNFKNVNDSFGHLYGDSVIKQIAKKLKKKFYSEHILGRLGGDEFCIFINYNDLKQIDKTARDICNMLNKSFFNDNVSVKISASIGISLFPENGKDFERLYLLADKALYKAKKDGKNKFEFAE